MSLKVHLRSEAEADIEDAATWYDRQRKGLGQEFLDDVLVALDTISENPNIYLVVYHATRGVLVDAFVFFVAKKPLSGCYGMSRFGAQRVETIKYMETFYDSARVIRTAYCGIG